MEGSRGSRRPRPAPRRRRPPVTPRHPHGHAAEPPTGRRRAIALGMFGVVIAAIVVVVVLSGAVKSSPSASDGLDRYLRAWSTRDDTAAASLTDAPATALAALRANRAGLDGASVSATRISVTDDDSDEPLGRIDVDWNVPDAGAFDYTVRVRLRQVDGKWRVVWSPNAVYPGLTNGRRLGTTRTPQARGRILDRNGDPLVESRPVVEVGVIAGSVTDPRATATAMASATGIREGPYERAIRNGGKQEFVQAITLRPEDYDAVSSTLSTIPGIRTVQSTAQLAPTKAFGRQLLGGVGELTAEQLRRLGPGYAVGDTGGQWGLEQAFESQLAGTPTRAIVIRNAQGAPVRTVTRRRGTPGQDVRTLLDEPTQAAAEDALADVDPTAKVGMVAVQPSTGNVLAVANRPVDSTFDRALVGQYPPGSTFKIVTTDALISAGAITPDSTVACPTTVNVGGRVYKNFEGEGGATEPFSTAFAQSCNTAFVPLARRLAPNALTQAGAMFGLGTTPKLPVDAFAGSVPQPSDLAARGAAMIGQDKILASPLGMAGVIATVANGRWRAPRLVPSDPKRAGAPLSRAVLGDLQTLTRDVVTSGTGTALAGISGEVHGKSGTAEFGTGNPPPTHAWFVAYRDDVAVAVIVERGESGASVAAPLVEKFFEALDAGASATDTGTTPTTF